jgi:hypothetical protein
MGLKDVDKGSIHTAEHHSDLISWKKKYVQGAGKLMIYK